MALVFGSMEWYEKVKELANKDEDFKKGTADWEGAMRTVVIYDEELLKDYSKEEYVRSFMGTLGLMSKEQRAQFEGTPMGNLMKKLGYSLDVDVATIDPAESAKRFSQLTLDDVKGVETHGVFEPHHGVLKEMRPILPDEYKDARFTLTGPYSAWKAMATGKANSTQLVMSGKMKLEGDMAYIMRHMAAMNALNSIYQQIELVP
ncbi:MAG: SCP2 sterol-binding domain-containing protein [Dehalococcoidales bacterium]|nr:SCP2 sterol-binding domain-containing protein [Dehalococcoidales bacterium]